jgi:Uma2 family endonuclease
MAQVASSGYTVEDLDWLRDDLGFAHIELDPWGSLIVTPASDEHETAVATLAYQAIQQLDLPAGCVRSNGFAWLVPGGSGYLNIPDLTVLADGWRRIEDLHVTPPPLLIAEVASPSTRRADRGHKLSDYRQGGANAYLLVDLPSEPGADTAFELYDFLNDRHLTAVGSLDVVIAGTVVHFDLTEP